MKLYWIVLLTAIPLAKAQSSSVELLGTITANQAINGLGFNLDPDQDWEWAAAAAAGATHARIQCSWSGVEKQTPPPLNLPEKVKYIQDPKCVSAFESARKYGIHPTVTAAFGPPYHQILTVTLTKAASPGDASLSIALVSGVGGDSLSSVRFPYDYITKSGSKPFTSRHSYQGTLIADIKLIDSINATVTLASALTSNLPVGTSLAINEILYPSTATDSPNDPSVIAYSNYVIFLAQDMASRGVTGDIELWNEPPWANDPWDNRCLLFDKNLQPPCPAIPGPVNEYQPNYGFVAVLQDKLLPVGITLTWNGTSGSGWASILDKRMYEQSGIQAKQPQDVVTKESFHPYGNSPEQVMWTTSCLEDTAEHHLDKQLGAVTRCYLSGEPTNSNNLSAVQLDMIAKRKNSRYGVGHDITETGIIPPVAGLRVPQARFILRQFIGFEADGITPIEFYKLYDRGALSDPNFSFIEQLGKTTTFSANPSYVAISGLMQDIKPISKMPVAAYTSTTLPSVVKYTGTYPLSTVHMVGSRQGQASNSDAFMIWQRSYPSCDSDNKCGIWITQASPPAAPVDVAIPLGMKVTRIVNLTSRVTVPYTTHGGQITFYVADDPIEILVDPV